MSVIIHTHIPRPRKKKYKKFPMLKADNARLAKKLGYVKPSTSVVSLPEPTHSRWLSGGTIPENGYRRDLEEYKWKKGITENPEAAKEAESKKKMVAPAYNKGPLMYITAEADLTTLGKKV